MLQNKTLAPDASSVNCQRKHKHKHLRWCHISSMCNSDKRIPLATV